MSFDATDVQVKKAVEAGNLDVAKVYAANAIREKNVGLNYLKLASKLDAVAGKLKQVGGWSKGAPSACRARDPC